MAKVRQTVTWANFETRLRAFLGIASPEREDDLQELLDVATRDADRYMNNFFVDSSGADIDPLPLAVTRGLLIYIKTALDVEDSGLMYGVSSVKTGDLSQSFGGARYGGFDPDRAAIEAAKKYWKPFRRRWDV